MHKSNHRISLPQLPLSLAVKRFNLLCHSIYEIENKDELSKRIEQLIQLP